MKNGSLTRRSPVNGIGFIKVNLLYQILKRTFTKKIFCFSGEIAKGSLTMSSEIGMKQLLEMCMLQRVQEKLLEKNTAFVNCKNVILLHDMQDHIQKG
jgi:hypothetical protein